MEVNHAARAAVPAYLGQGFGDAAPGHKFYLYLGVWDSEWKKVNNKADEARDVVSLTDDDRARLRALADRQAALLDDDCVSLPARSIAPFSTGLGIEHPLENGFAFLNPYGLPYLPGSSVKGVLRQAARELGGGGAFEDGTRSWTAEEIEALFGRAGDEGDDADRWRGALSFWDLHPVLPETQDLKWEVMTPHQKDYYQNQGPPHDNGSPVPILFLSLPPGTRFAFNVACDRTLLSRRAPALLEGDKWQELTRELFEHAFDWLGFGAKTSVGYGAMEIDDRAQRAVEEAQEQQRREAEDRARLAELDPETRRAEVLLRGKANPDQPAHKYLLELLEQGAVPEEERSSVAIQALRRLAERKDEIVSSVKDKKRRKKKLDQLEADEARLHAIKGEN